MILIIDHYDSFIDMIADYVKSLNFDCVIIKTDDKNLGVVALTEFSHIIIGPGPGHPTDKSLDNVYSIINNAIIQKLPLLGICLGHQMIGHYFGASIKTADKISHGITSLIHTKNDSCIFKDLPTQFNVTRYHSLIIDNQNLPNNIIVTAKTEQNEIMAIQHLTHKIFGVQFHPESVMTEYGHEMLRNFFEIK
ncbi:MAG: aminodeoxychorismate/anthranilate synthase component II [Neisseriaceae bacterium]|jgi:anthranilate synthase component 2|nr:MAG: aminodeoxychorismate/anthranilate synthase component II [Neisseriaceae bacterium]